MPLTSFIFSLLKNNANTRIHLLGSRLPSANIGFQRKYWGDVNREHKAIVLDFHGRQRQRDRERREKETETETERETPAVQCVQNIIPNKESATCRSKISWCCFATLNED